MESKTILITGAGGFLGSHIADHYAALAWTVIGVGRSDKWCEDLFKQDNCEFFKTEIPHEAFSVLVEKTKPDILVHCAGTSTVSHAYSNPFESFQETVGGTAFVLDSVRQHSPKTHMIFTSSAAVYGSPDKLPITEESPRAPMSPYGHQKLMCEQMISRYTNDYSLSTTILRIFSAYGERLRKQVLWDLCGNVLREDKLSVRGAPADSRDYIHWKDLVKAVAITAEHKAEGVFNVASGKEVTIEELAKLLRDELAPDKAIEFTGKNLQGYPSRWLADISKLNALGFISSVDISQGVKDYCSWFKEESGLCLASASPQLEAPSGQEA